MNCEQVHFCGVIAMSCFTTSPGVFFELLHANGIELPGGTLLTVRTDSKNYAVQIEENSE